MLQNVYQTEKGRFDSVLALNFFSTEYHVFNNNRYLYYFSGNVFTWATVYSSISVDTDKENKRSAHIIEPHVPIWNGNTRKG